MVMLDTSTRTNEVRSDEATESTSPLILRQTVHSSTATTNTTKTRSLRLAMLGCEDHPPYGPTEHTAQLFLELLVDCLREEYCSTCTSSSWNVSIAVYRCCKGEYPVDWDEYDGILLPGSFAAAYDDEPWISKLQQIVQRELVAPQRKTLAVCFGHQLLAESFASSTNKEGRNNAQKYPRGSRAGRYCMELTQAGRVLLLGGNKNEPDDDDEDEANPNAQTSCLNLYYTHGDMVQQLPPCAIALGQELNEGLPIQAAAYFASPEEAQRFGSTTANTVTQSKPYAISFQAHPEYAVSRELGLEFTLGRILTLMEEKKHIGSEAQKMAREDAVETFELVRRQSKEAFVASARALGWFP